MCLANTVQSLNRPIYREKNVCSYILPGSEILNFRTQTYLDAVQNLKFRALTYSSDSRREIHNQKSCEWQCDCKYAKFDKWSLLHTVYGKSLGCFRTHSGRKFFHFGKLGFWKGTQAMLPLISLTIFNKCL